LKISKRAEINNYFEQQLSRILKEKEKKRGEVLAKKKKSNTPIRFLRALEPSEADRSRVKQKAIQKYPEIIDYYLA
jgi:hypothetical protein